MGILDRLAALDSGPEPAQSGSLLNRIAALDGPSDVRSQIAARKVNPPAAAMGDPNVNQGNSIGDYIGAGVRGVAGLAKMLPDITDTNTMMVGAASNAATHAMSAQLTDNPLQKGLRYAGAVPIVGGIADMADKITQPAVAYSGGRAPSNQENLNAVEGGTGAAGLMLAPRVMPDVARAAGGVAEAVPKVGTGIRAAAAEKFGGVYDAHGAAAKSVPRMMAEGVKPNEAALGNIERQLNIASKKLTVIEAASGKVQHPSAPIVEEIMGGVKDLVTPDTGVLTSKAADSAAKMLGDLARRVYESSRDGAISQRDLLKLRKSWDIEIEKKGGYEGDGYTVDPTTATSVFKTATNVLRDRINSVEAVGNANAEVSHLLNARRLVTEAMPAKTGLTLDEKIAMTTGLTAAGTEAALGHPYLATATAVGSTVKPIGKAILRTAFGPSARAGRALTMDSLGQILGGKAPGGKIVGGAPPEPPMPPTNVVPMSTPGSGFGIDSGRPIVNGRRLTDHETHLLAQKIALENGFDVSAIGSGRTQNPRAVRLSKILAGQ